MWRRVGYQTQDATARADDLFGKVSVNKCFEPEFNIAR